MRRNSVTWPKRPSNSRIDDQVRLDQADLTTADANFASAGASTFFTHWLSEPYSEKSRSGYRVRLEGATGSERPV